MACRDVFNRRREFVRSTGGAMRRYDAGRFRTVCVAHVLVPCHLRIRHTWAIRLSDNGYYMLGQSVVVLGILAPWICGAVCPQARPDWADAPVSRILHR